MSNISAPQVAQADGSYADSSYFDDLVEGKEFDAGSVEVTETAVMMFAAITGDNNPLHVDEEAARNGPFRQRVAHGMLVISLASGMASQVKEFSRMQPMHRKILEWDFAAPVFINDVIHVRFRILALQGRPLQGKGKATVQFTVSSSKGQTLGIGKFLIIMPMRPTMPEPSKIIEGV